MLAALASGTVAGLVAQASTLYRSLSAIIFAGCCGGSLYCYWVLAPKLGRATALATLSLPWGIAVLALGLFTPGNHDSANLAAYGFSGLIIPWLIGALTLPTAGLVRTSIRLNHWMTARKYAAKSRTKQTRRSQPRRSALKHSAPTR